MQTSNYQQLSSYIYLLIRDYYYIIKWLVIVKTPRYKRRSIVGGVCNGITVLFCIIRNYLNYSSFAILFVQCSQSKGAERKILRSVWDDSVK